MSDLNSMMIEGTVKAPLNVELFESKLTLSSKRSFHQADGSYKTTENIFPILLNQKLTEIYKANLIPGMKIRVVGFLICEKEKIGISAEYIEQKGRF